jgi:hypothetical protein
VPSQNIKKTDNAFSSNGSNYSNYGGSYWADSACTDKSSGSNSMEDHIDSEVTKAIKSSIERSVANNCSIDNNVINFKEFVDLTKSVISEIPVVVNNTGKAIDKIVEVGKNGINTINSFATSLNYGSKKRCCRE